MIFVVEDETRLRELYTEFLQENGHDVEAFGTAEGALKAAEKSAPPDVLVTDLQLPGMDGLALQREMRALDPGVVRIIMTAHATVQSAVEAMRDGCYEYLEKPVDLERLSRLILRAMLERRSAVELEWNRPATEVAKEMLGQSAAIESVRRQIATLGKLGKDSPPVLITGETGVGKGLIARSIHVARAGEKAPWIEVNCAALPATLIEAELFGYERSAFTDAKQAKPGLFEAAAGGTIFLDEIGEVPREVQSKLLQVVESSSVRRLGSVRERTISAAIIAATNIDLNKAVTEGSFRADLYHRLAAFTIPVPPLRERGEDVLMLAESFLRQSAARYRKALTGLSPEAEQTVLGGVWLGNVRELRFTIERAVILAPDDAELLAAGDILVNTVGEIPNAASPAQAGAAGASLVADRGGIQVQLPQGGVEFADLEKAVLSAALAMCDGNVSHAARLLGLKRDAMRYRIRKLGLE